MPTSMKPLPRRAETSPSVVSVGRASFATLKAAASGASELRRRGAMVVALGRVKSFAASAVVVGIGLASVLVACGPSFQQVYEGDARFEHCYFLDESADVPMPKKDACWRDWTQRYTYGQTRDRIEYALARHRALSRVGELPTDEVMMQAAPGEGAARVSAPAPTNAFAPPPVMLKSEAGAPDAGMAPANASVKPTSSFAADGGVGNETLPYAACSGECESAIKACQGSCEKRGCDACTRDYKKCMRNCFSDKPKSK